MSGSSTSFTRGENPLRADKLNTALSERVLRSGDQMSGYLTLVGNPTQANHGATKQYVDAAIAGVGAGNYLPISGGALSGPLYLSNDPTTPPGAATKRYVDAGVQGVTAQFNGAGNVGRNLLHNSLFSVAQRGIGPFTTSVVTLDRWGLSLSGSDTASVSRVNLSPSNITDIGDEEAQTCLGTNISGSSAANSYTYISQHIEILKRLSGKTVTVSFWANASAALKLGINGLMSFGTGGSPTANFWIMNPGLSVQLGPAFARYSVTFHVPSVTGYTFGTNGNDFFQLAFWFSSSATTNALAGNIGVQTGTINLWGVQLEIGSVATPFEKISFGDDLRHCQRFYQTGQVVAAGFSSSASGVGTTFSLPVVMRVTPAIAILTNSDTSLTSPTTALLSPYSIYFSGTTPASTVGWILNRTFSATADL